MKGVSEGCGSSYWVWMNKIEEALQHVLPSWHIESKASPFEDQAHHKHSRRSNEFVLQPVGDVILSRFEAERRFDEDVVVQCDAASSSFISRTHHVLFLGFSCDHEDLRSPNKNEGKHREL